MARAFAVLAAAASVGPEHDTRGSSQDVPNEVILPCFEMFCPLPPLPGQEWRRGPEPLSQLLPASEAYGSMCASGRMWA